jgi:hypothetical protein
MITTIRCFIFQAILGSADGMAEALLVDLGGWGEPAIVLASLQSAGDAEAGTGSGTGGGGGGSSASSSSSSGTGSGAGSGSGNSAKETLTNVTVFGSIVHEVLLVSLELGRAVACKYAARLGEMGGINCVVSGDVAFYKHADTDCIAAFNVATRAFGLLLHEESALDILKQGFALCVTRSPSFNLMVSFLKLCLAASLCAMQSPPSDPRDVKDDFASMRGRIDAQLAAQDSRLKAKRPASAISRPSSASTYDSASAYNSGLPPTSILSRPGTTASGKANNNNHGNQGSRITFAAKNDYNSVISPSPSSNSIGFGSVGDDEDEDDMYLEDDVIAARNAAKETVRRQALVEAEYVRVQAALEAADAAMQLAMSRPKVTPLRYTIATREAVCQTLASSAVKVMVVMAVHRSSLVVSHTGLLVIRLMLRESILKRAGFDELLSASLLTYVQPLNETAGEVRILEVG